MSVGELDLASRGRSSGERWMLFATPVAGAVAIAIIGVVIVSFMIWIGRGMAPLPVPFGRTPAGVLGLVLSPVCYAAVGGVMAGKLPRNPIGWLFLAAGVGLGMMLPINLVVAAAHETFRPASGLVVGVAWVRTAFATPTVLTSLVLAALVFPDGRPLPGRWGYAVWLIAAGGLLLVMGVATNPFGLLTYPTLPNPFALPLSLEALATGTRLAGFALLLGGIALALRSMWLRYRRGDSLMRAQLRWIVLAAGLTAATSLPFLLSSYVLRVDDRTGEMLAALSQVGLCTFPVAAALAISRYRLFDIDTVISRTLVYVPLTALLGGLYTAGIALFQRLFVAVTGQQSDMAVVGAILVVASAFTPMRRGLEGVVDRRFSNRPPPEHARAASLQAPPHASVVRVHRDGRVDCPAGRDHTLRDCLRCPGLVAFIDEPDLAVVCRPTAAD